MPSRRPMTRINTSQPNVLVYSDSPFVVGVSWSTPDDAGGKLERNKQCGTSKRCVTRRFGEGSCDDYFILCTWNAPIMVVRDPHTIHGWVVSVRSTAKCESFCMSAADLSASDELVGAT